MKTVICCLNSKYIHSSLAPWCLLAGVRAYCSAEVTAKVVEGTVNEPQETVLTRLYTENAAVIGFCTYIWNVQAVLELAERIKSCQPSVQIVLGGPEVSYRAEQILKNYPFVDFVISGEGEYPFAALLNALQTGDNRALVAVEGLCFRLGHHLHMSAPYIGTGDPVSPYCEEYFETLNGRIGYLETSRGCPYNCAFCLSGRCGTVRFFSLETAKENILRLANSGAKTVKFVDRTFNADKKRAYEIFSFILSHYGKEIPDTVCFHFEIAGDILNDALIDLLATALKGAIQLEIGLQSFNETTLASIHRKTDTQKLIRNIKRLIVPRNIHIHIDLIAGLPYEDYASFADSFNKAFFLAPDMLQFGFLKLLYGAPMRENAVEYPCAFSEAPPYEVQSTPWLSETDLQKMHGIEDAFDRIWNSGRFRRTVQYAFSVTKTEPFTFFADFAEYLSAKNASTEKVPLDVYSESFFTYLCSLSQTDNIILRDTMVCDRLATNASGVLPAFLKVQDRRLKEVRTLLNADPKTRARLGVKRAVALLYSENRAVYADYIDADRVTGEYPLQYISLKEK
ncbi:MAG: DUF4080 domain-containing protein [Candidatus Fimenecus sp.]